MRPPDFLSALNPPSPLVAIDGITGAIFVSEVRERMPALRVLDATGAVLGEFPRDALDFAAALSDPAVAGAPKTAGGWTSLNYDQGANILPHARVVSLAVDAPRSLLWTASACVVTGGDAIKALQPVGGFVTLSIAHTQIGRPRERVEVTALEIPLKKEERKNVANIIDAEAWCELAVHQESGVVFIMHRNCVQCWDGAQVIVVLTDDDVKEAVNPALEGYSDFSSIMIVGDSIFFGVYGDSRNVILSARFDAPSSPSSGIDLTQIRSRLRHLRENDDSKAPRSPPARVHMLAVPAWLLDLAHNRQAEDATDGDPPPAPTTLIPCTLAVAARTDGGGGAASVPASRAPPPPLRLTPLGNARRTWGSLFLPPCCAPNSASWDDVAAFHYAPASGELLVSSKCGGSGGASLEARLLRQILEK
jgi:hypothetical protein